MVVRSPLDVDADLDLLVAAVLLDCWDEHSVELVVVEVCGADDEDVAFDWFENLASG